MTYSKDVQLLKSTEVARFLNVDRHTVVKLVNTRELKGTRVGSDIRIHPSDLEAYIAKNSVRRR